MEAFIQESRRKIKEAINNNKLIIFVGAGVSNNSGYPSWRDLVDKLAKGIGINTENIGHDEYLKIPQYYYII